MITDALHSRAEPIVILGALHDRSKVPGFGRYDTETGLVAGTTYEFESIDFWHGVPNFKNGTRKHVWRTSE